FRGSRWNAGGNVFLTAFPIVKNQEPTARFYGLNARVGYTVTPEVARWKVMLMGGAYYTTMSVSDDRFGFRNMGGPQLYPSVQWEPRQGHVFQICSKFSPVSELSQGFRLRPGRDREIDGGVSYHAGKWSGTIDVAHLSLLI